MTDTGQNRPFADGRLGIQSTPSVAEAYRLQAHARRLQGEAMAGALRGASALLLGALRTVAAFVRCAAAGQAKRVPSPVACR